MTLEITRFIYLILWIILVVCDTIIGESNINAYFDADNVDDKRKRIKNLFENIVSIIAESAFFMMLILRSYVK